MIFFYCDASAVGKRNTPEIGSNVVKRLFDTVSDRRLIMLTQAIGETLSIVIRRRNSGIISERVYSEISQSLNEFTLRFLNRSEMNSSQPEK